MKLPNNMVTRNVREWLTLAILIFGFFYLSGDSNASKLSFADGFGAPSIAFVSADDTEPAPNDVSGSDIPVKESIEFLVEANYVGQFGSSDKKIEDSNSHFANQSTETKVTCSKDSKSSLSLVDSDLARQFTLLGEKPSGTG